MQFVDPNVPQQAEMDAVTGTKEEQERFAIPVVPRCDYVKEKESGQIHKYTERFAERGDLVEPYSPTVAERLNFGEDIMDLFNRGVTVEQFKLANVPEETLMKYGLIETAPQAPAAPAAPAAPMAGMTPVAKV